MKTKILATATLLSLTFGSAFAAETKKAPETESKSFLKTLEDSPFGLSLATDNAVSRAEKASTDKDGSEIYKIDGYSGIFDVIGSYKLLENYKVTGIAEWSYAQDKSATLDNLYAKIARSGVLTEKENGLDLTLAVSYFFLRDHKYIEGTRKNGHRIEGRADMNKSFTDKLSLWTSVRFAQYFEKDGVDSEQAGLRTNRVRVIAIPTYSLTDKVSMSFGVDYLHSIKQDAGNSDYVDFSPELGYSFTDKLSGSVYYSMNPFKSNDGEFFVKDFLKKGSAGFTMSYKAF